MLHGKLKELGLAQTIPLEDKPHKSTYIRRRRHSADSLYEYTEDVQEVPVTHLTRTPCVNCVKPSYILRPFHETPERYVQFLILVCETYKELVDVTASGIEAICQQILTQCQPNNEVSGYDIHKSIFYDYILKDRLISVGVRHNPDRWRLKMCSRICMTRR